MLKKSLFVSGVLLIATMMVAVYLFGVHHGYTGGGLAVTKEAIAAQESSAKASINWLSPKRQLQPRRVPRRRRSSSRLHTFQTLKN
jgi:hypothetical protein